MAEPMTPGSGPEPPATEEASEDRALRERVRELTSQVLQQGRLDTAGVRDVVRAVTGLDTKAPEPAGKNVPQAVAEAVKGLDATILRSATAAQRALERLSSRGEDFTDNDLTDALVSLRQLQEDCAAATARIVDATSGDLRRELSELAAHAQAVGADASARAASAVTELASRLGSAYQESAGYGLETARTYGARVALLASGILAGVGDALQEQSRTRKDSQVP